MVNKALFFWGGGGTFLHQGGGMLTSHQVLVGESLCDRHGNGYRPGCAKFVPNPRGAMKKNTN